MSSSHQTPTSSPTAAPRSESYGILVDFSPSRSGSRDSPHSLTVTMAIELRTSGRKATIVIDTRILNPASTGPGRRREAQRLANALRDSILTAAQGVLTGARSPLRCSLAEEVELILAGKV